MTHPTTPPVRLTLVPHQQAERQQADDVVEHAFRLGLAAADHIAVMVGGATASVPPAADLLTTEEQAELVDAIRWILHKRRAADVYPGGRLA